MTSGHIKFAVPGDLKTKTGGYIYDRRLIEDLREQSWQVDHIELPAGFPDPTPSEMVQSFEHLHRCPSHCPLIVDGLAFGALDPDQVAQLQAPLVALVHHPLAKENGMDAERRATLFETERRNLEMVQHIIVPSPHTGQILISEYEISPDIITVASPGIDRPQGVRREIDPPLILSVGIHQPRKGHDVLLRALAGIADLDWQAVIVGSPLDDACSDALHGLRASLGLGERVTIAGLVDRDVLEAHYQTASIFALATRYEGYGMVFDEALAHGLPIVSCGVGAVPDTVPSKAGLLVPPDAPDSFGDALRSLLSNPEHRQSIAAAAHSIGVTRHSWSQTAAIVAGALQPILPHYKSTGVFRDAGTNTD
ncbi:glycosyltransferase family 4 protein [uncultured Ruegeria sp.]|uniref:glycosyltransferase family 4 protein n=1 Tax=uncultured Ruegeria sp. TaxID=259304 RepID=UPI00262A8845|nr:glycosyltransferase family 4 protein [uncultured Ruegeria sp.]